MQPFELPVVSLILAVRNEEKFIARTLTAVVGQSYPPNRMEVIIADGMSADGTRETVKTFQDTSRNIILIENPGKIVATGLNAALRQARGDIIVRVDGHTIIAPDYVEQCVTALSRTAADNVGGRMHAAGEGITGDAIALATSSPFGVGGARFHYSEKEEWVDTVYLGAWRREVFERIGLFDEEQRRNQDDEFNYRLGARGGKILLTPAIKSTYYCRRSLRSLWTQYFEYGFWKVRVLQKHPKQMRPRQFIPALFVISLGLAGVAGLFLPVGRDLLAATLSAYGIANIAVSIITALRKGVRHFLLLPLVFGVLHFSYGVGFLAGLVKFRNRWGSSGRVPSMPMSALPGEA
jgi:succinoglycan biosynthesis protein ExoA